MSTAQHLTESSTGLKGHTALGSYEIAAVPSGLAHSIYTSAVSTRLSQAQSTKTKLYQTPIGCYHDLLHFSFIGASMHRENMSHACRKLSGLQQMCMKEGYLIG